MDRNRVTRFSLRRAFVLVAIIAIALTVFRLLVFEPVQFALARERSLQAGLLVLAAIDEYSRQRTRLPTSWDDLSEVNAQGDVEDFNVLQSLVKVSFGELSIREDAVQIATPDHQDAYTFLEQRRYRYKEWSARQKTSSSMRN